MFTTLQETNDYYRNQMLPGRPAGIIVEMWRDLAFQDKQLVLSGVPDSVAAEFYHEAAMVVEPLLPALLVDYLAFGRLMAQLIYEITKGYWTGCSIISQDYCQVTFSPISPEPSLAMVTSEEHRDWATTLEPRIVQQRKNMDPDLVRLMREGKNIPIEQRNVLYLARKAFASDFFGTSFIPSSEAKHGLSNLTHYLWEMKVVVGLLDDENAVNKHYLPIANKLRDHICGYVFGKMFSILAEQQQYPWTPTIEWVEDAGAESRTSIINRSLAKLGYTIEELVDSQSTIWVS